MLRLLPLPLRRRRSASPQPPHRLPRPLRRRSSRPRLRPRPRPKLPLPPLRCLRLSSRLQKAGGPSPATTNRSGKASAATSNLLLLDSGPREQKGTNHPSRDSLWRRNHGDGYCAGIDSLGGESLPEVDEEHSFDHGGSIVTTRSQSPPQLRQTLKRRPPPCALACAPQPSQAGTAGWLSRLGGQRSGGRAIGMR